MKTYKIPNKPEAFDEGAAPEPELYDALTYEPAEGEIIEVSQWIRWPSYDFIFGVPAKDSPMYEKETAYFQYRDTRHKHHHGFYIDVVELLHMVEGFATLVEMSKTHNPDIWEKHHKLIQKLEEEQKPKEATKER